VSAAKGEGALTELIGRPHSPVHGGRGEGGGDRAGPQRRERKGDARGNGSATTEQGPRGRERRGARAKQLAPTGRPHWEASEGGRAHEREGCR
jgi:hypothetical protein